MITPCNGRVNWGIGWRHKLAKGSQPCILDHYVQLHYQVDEWDKPLLRHRCTSATQPPCQPVIPAEQAMHCFTLSRGCSGEVTWSRAEWWHQGPSDTPQDGEIFLLLQRRGSHLKRWDREWSPWQTGISCYVSRDRKVRHLVKQTRTLTTSFIERQGHSCTVTLSVWKEKVEYEVY